MIGQLIGNYRVTRLLGKGGMGLVFEAVHEQIKRRAAIKILHAEYSRSPEVIRRFFNEALAVNVVQHPSIVGVFESGQLPDGAAFIVMEFLDGETLTSCLNNKGVFKESEALLLVRQISSALAATHAKDIVHRDLKSDNVMLVNDPEVPGGRRVKILDFGLAKIAEKHQSNAVQTKDGVVMGTPSYMPPEQWMSATMVDAKSDVYSLGIIFFEMLTARRPFVGETINQLMMGHMYEDPPLVTAYEQTVSAGTAQLINLMLTKTRTARPAMSEVSARIEQLLAAPVPAPASPPQKSSQPRDVANSPTLLPDSPNSLLVQPEGPVVWTNMHLDIKVPDSGPPTQNTPPDIIPSSQRSDKAPVKAITAAAPPHKAEAPGVQPKPIGPNGATTIAQSPGGDAQHNVRSSPEPAAPAATVALLSPAPRQVDDSARPDPRRAQPHSISPLVRYAVLSVAVILAILLAVLLGR